MPVVGIPVYLLVGPNRFARKKIRLSRLRRARGTYLDAWDRATARELSDLGQLARLAIRPGPGGAMAQADPATFTARGASLCSGPAPHRAESPWGKGLVDTGASRAEHSRDMKATREAGYWQYGRRRTVPRFGEG